MDTTSPSSPAQPGAPRVIPTQRARTWLLPLGAVVLAVAAAGAGVLVGRQGAAGAADADTPVSGAQPPAQDRPAAGSTAPGAAAPHAAAGQRTERRADATPAKPVPRAGERPAAPSATAEPVTPLETRPAAAAAVCTRCGVVESVKTEVHQGEGSGVGAVAGGVVGGLLGNQVGKGNGRTAMTVLGAIGGGMAGNAIEKQQRARTVYVVRVRMDDGTLRSFSHSEPWTVGQRVSVDGQALQLLTEAAPARGERTLQTADTGLRS